MCIYQTILLQAESDKRSIFKQSTAGLYFSRKGTILRLKNPVFASIYTLLVNAHCIVQVLNFGCPFYFGSFAVIGGTGCFNLPFFILLNSSTLSSMQARPLLSSFHDIVIYNIYQVKSSDSISIPMSYYLLLFFSLFVSSSQQSELIVFEIIGFHVP